MVLIYFAGSKHPLDKDIDLEQIARGTPGFSGAELSNLVNEAALKSSVDGMNAVTMGALEYAKDKIMMGSERKTAVISPETLKCTAYHEVCSACPVKMSIILLTGFRFLLFMCRLGMH